MAGIGPGGEPGRNVELPEEPADDLVGVVLTAQPVELTDDLQQRLLDVLYRSFRIELALLIETALAFQKFFTVKVEHRIDDWLARRIGQEA